MIYDQIVNSDFPDTIYLDRGRGDDNIVIVFLARTQG